MQEYIQYSTKISKNDYPHVAESYYPYGYIETEESKNGRKDDGYEAEIHFLAPHDNEVLICEYYEGQLNGQFELRTMYNGQPFTLMHGLLVDGEINGFCEINDPIKGKIFEGTWEDGKRCGTCVEYEFGNVCFQGSYRNDKRHGYGWEYHDNELQREGEWRNGVYQTTYEITHQTNFVDTGLGMIISDINNEHLITCVEWEDAKKNGKAYAYSTKLGRVVQERLYMHGDEIDRTIIPKMNVKQGTITLENGNKWTGEIYENMCTGEGELRDVKGNLIYKGSMFRNMRYGNGTSYMNNMKTYSGLWQVDKKMGDGVSYDSKGNIEHEGIWINDIYEKTNLIVNDDLSSIQSSVVLKQFIIGDNVLNDIIDIDFTKYALLQKIQIGSESLKELSEMNLRGLQQLQSIEIGKNSMTLCINCVSPIQIRDSNLKVKTISVNENRIRAEMKRLVIADCPSIESVTLHQGACSDFFEFILENVPKLRTLQIGDIGAPAESKSSFNFFYANSLEIMDCPSLESIILGNRAFYSVAILRIYNLPSLKTLTFAPRACFGHFEKDNNEKTVYVSRMSIRNCEQLEELSFNNNFVFFQKMYFDNLPKCTSVKKVSNCFPKNKDGIKFYDHVTQELKDIVMK